MPTTTTTARTTATALAIVGTAPIAMVKAATTSTDAVNGVRTAVPPAFHSRLTSNLRLPLLLCQREVQPQQQSLPRPADTSEDTCAAVPWSTGDKRPRTTTPRLLLLLCYVGQDTHERAVSKVELKKLNNQTHSPSWPWQDCGFSHVQDYGHGHVSDHRRGNACGHGHGPRTARRYCCVGKKGRACAGPE